MFVLQEPIWGQQCLLWFHQLLQYHFFIVVFPVLADGLVLLYPLYLLILYIYGVLQRYSVTALHGSIQPPTLKGLFPLTGEKKGEELKESAVWIFLAAFVSAAVTIIIQLFLIKARPDTVLNLIFQQKRDILLYHYIPSPSFPSDHATMAMSIAVATLLWGLRCKKK